MSVAVEGPAHDHSIAVGVAERSGGEPSRVPWRRLAGDLAALVAAWAVASLVVPAGMWTAVPIAGIGVWLIASQQLYATGIADMRTVELHRLMVVTLRLAAVAVTVHWILPGPVSPAGVAIGCALSLAGLVLARIGYRVWLRNARASGRLGRSIIFVGIDEPARTIRWQLDDRPELGFAVVGAFGPREAAHRYGMDDVWAGHVVDAPAFVRRYAADAVLVSSTALGPGEIEPIVSALLDETSCQVHLTTALGGLDQRRLRPAQVDYEPVLSIDRVGPRRAQSLVKRAIDVTLGSIALILALPLLAVAAIAIKVGDRGPVLFRQVRVGRDGHPFTVYKLRTMTIDAEVRLVNLSSHNERHGPLFKMEEDPRVTRVGSLIRDLSIDELPQLWNVLKGDMSLVGPRPALPEEDAVFHDRLRGRNRVRPGITGLWQVEARDNPSFLAYERLDLFYVENWSLGLDLTILVATVESELARVATRFIPRRQRAAKRSVSPQLEPVAISPPVARNNSNRVPLATLEALPRSGTAAG